MIQSSGVLGLTAVVLSVLVAGCVSRVAFLPGAVSPTGDVDFVRYDLTSPRHGFYKRNATHLEVSSPSAGYLAAPLVPIDPITVTLVDHFGIPLRRGFACVVHMSLVDYPAALHALAPSDIVPPHALSVPIDSQSVTFRGMVLTAPPVGKYRLHFKASPSNMTRNDAEGTFDFSIVPHVVAHRMEWIRTPLPFVNSYAPLSRQPALRLVDEVGNTVVDERATGNVTATLRDAHGSVVPQTHVSRGTVETVQGIATFTDLQIDVHPLQQGRPYNITLTYTPLHAGVVNQELSVNMSIQSSFCNTSSLRPVVHYYPDRTRAGDGDVDVTIRGGPFLASMRHVFVCRVDAIDSIARFLDECNLNCTVPDKPSGGTASISISTDGGKTFSDPVFVHFIGVDSALRLRFDDPDTELSNVLQLNPLGNTVVGNISVYVTDQLSTDMWNFTAQDYIVSLSNAILSLSGNTVTSTREGFGQFLNVSIPGFPETGDYVLSLTATNVITQETIFGSRRVSLAYSRDRCEPPPIATTIASVGCMGRVTPMVLSSCGSGETHTLTIQGKYFGLSGAVAFVGSYKCAETTHDSINVGSQLNCRCYFPTANSTITVVTSTSQIYVTPTPSLLMSAPVVVSSVVGCPTTIFPSTGGCFTNTSTRVTVYGSNFGASNAAVFLNHITSKIAIRCTNATHSTTSPSTSISCSIPVALGVGLVVSVRNAQTGQLGYPSNYAAISYIPSNGVLCQTDAEGYFCSQRGVCFLQNGTCNCIRSPTQGFWTGEFCQTCVQGYYGASCTTPCPSCSVTSQCDDGVDGSGACVCQYGWGGALCDLSCPGGSATPCNLHGICSSALLTCACFNSEETGYWGGTTCGTCSEGWSGAACKTPCPRANNRVCSGHGTCIDGTCKCAQNYCDSACNVSFAGCSGCLNGTYGKDCSFICPGGVDNICNGNGFCGDGPFGNGLCTCYDGWGGPNCTITCPHGPNNLCSGHGQCDVDTGVCSCEIGFTLSDCGTECPGGAHDPCSGHGSCDVATSLCTCSDGWSAANCSVECPGGSNAPCTLHGTCVQATSTCECYADTTRGFWDGATCDTCGAEWWGKDCRQQCPFAYNLQCGGHGQCSDAVVCTCFESLTTGFWSGSNCGDCAFGYYGDACTQECPGTACNPCYSRGNCSQGVNGTGICSCDSGSDLGFWSGVVCDACAPDYYGDNCTSHCPLGLGNLTCSGRGDCADGRFGLGTCSCHGTYGGSVCDRCAYGYYGTACSHACPGLVGQPCLLRGTCESTETSSGTCTCDAGYGGTMCQYSCPTGPYGICNGQGVCVLNSLGTAMICLNCSSSATTGFWTGESCSSCISGYYGSLCKQACPGGASSPCNNRGTCSMGYTGNGECTCTTGYAGLSCEKTCVGGALIPCTGHGTCDGVTGECDCYSTASDGFWVGAACDSCNSAYESSSCTVPCPTSVSGTACSGHGACYQGICLTCTSGFCGPTCSATTGCVSCPAGTYGDDCKDCPGGRLTPCTHQGICLQGIFGNGNCVCNQGYRGTNCSIKCPGPVGVPCYGRGTCDTLGACTCSTNWAGSDCNTPCSGFDQRLANSTSCSGVGTCNKVDGSCSCLYGYGGSSCEIQCPGTNSPCNGQGFCRPADGTCECYTNTSIGFWNGPSCEYCQPGYYGATSCLNKCFQGVSDATFTQCVCNPYWSGFGCDTPCPGLLDGGNVCYGHGSCSWGRDAASLCTCDTNWYDPNCLTFCTKGGCDAVLINGQCNVKTGVCECQFDSAGHWDYADSTKTSCDVCHVYYFGERCESPCACSRHGTCDRRTGSCTCYADLTRGYWGGSSCGSCASGYIGVNCQNLNVAISPLGTVAAVATVPALDVRVGIICRDPLYPFVYVGTSPVMVLSAADVTLQTLNLGGLAMSCVYRSARELYIVTFSESRMRLSVVNRQTGEYLRTEYVPLPAAEEPPAAAVSHQRQLLQFEAINATTLNGAIMDATTILLPFSGETDDILVIPYGLGIVQYYQISSGIQVIQPTPYLEIVDAGPLEGSTSLFTLAAVAGNASFRHWEIALCSNSMPASSTAVLTPVATFYDRYGAYVSSICPQCTPVKVFGSGDLTVMVFAQAGVGMYLTRMSVDAGIPPYDASVPLSAVEAFFEMQYFYGSVCDVTATTIDVYAAAGYFAMTCGSDPSVIMKFQLRTCYVTGIIQLSRVGTDAVTVVRMAIDQPLRMMEVLTPLSRSQRVQKVSLYAVSKLTPLLADTKGGTLITVTGEGFIQGMMCVFTSTTVVADFVDQSSMICTAPPGGTVSCSGEPVEVSLAKAGPTNNEQLLQRVASASIREAINSETDRSLGFLHGSNVTVRGSGFILPSNASLLLCKLYSPTDLEATSVVVVATLISSYEVLCILPRVSVPVPKPSYLEVSIDGTVFSDSRVSFEVVGDASSLFISSPSSGELTVRAARSTTLPTVYVNVADSVSHPLGIYTDTAHTIRATLAAGSGFELAGTTLLNTSDGLAAFSDLTIIDPATGFVQLIFADARLMWEAYLYFTVVEGEPFQMFFGREPSNGTTNTNPTLSIQPVVGIRDASGNQLGSLSDKSVVIKTITLRYWYHDLNDAVVEREVGVSELNAEFRVEGVSITGKHQHEYFLNFTAEQLPEPTLISEPIVVGWCDTDAFAIENSTKCEACPANAVCDGTFVIRAKNGWWRADNTTLQFYSCAAPFSGDSCHDDGQCDEGYYGPRCSLCEVGYGRSGRFCSKCQSSDTNSAVVMIACVALLAVVTLMVYSIVMTSSKDLIPVLFRNFVTYAQILARLSDTHMPWPSVLDDLWRMINSIASLQAIDFSPFDCAMNANFFEKYTVTLLIPWGMVILVAPFAILVVRLYTKDDVETADALGVAAKCRSEEDEHLLSEINEATAQRRVTLIGEPSRRIPAANPLEAPQADILKPSGMENVLNNEVLKAASEGEARHRMNDWSHETLTRNRIDHVSHILSIRQARYTVGAVIVITAVTIFTLLYPTLVQSSGQVLQCETMDLGREGVVTLSTNQRDVSCTSSYYKFYSTLAISMIMVYGVSIPFGLIVVVLLLQRFGGMSMARAVLAFTMAGLKPELWFWESVNMMRKFLAMMVVVFVSDAKLQMIVFMWVMVIGFVLNVTFSPYTSKLVYLLECIGMAATVATMNMVLMFFFFTEESGDADYTQWGAIAISVAIIAVNAVAVLCYFVAIGQHVAIRVQKWRDSLANEEACQEAIQHRMSMMLDIVEEVRGLRTRRAELDQAIQAIDERLEEGMDQDTASPSYRNRAQLHNWQFPTDDNPFGDEDVESEGSDGSDSNSGDGAPKEGASRRATVTFAAAESQKKSSRRRSLWKKAVSQRASLRDFSISSQHDFVRRTSSGNIHAWVEPEPAAMDGGADVSTDKPMPADEETYLDGRELLAALGEGDVNDGQTGHGGILFGALRRTLRGGSDSDLASPSSPKSIRQDGGILSAEALRRMQQDDRGDPPAIRVGASGCSATWQQLDPQMLLDSNSSASDASTKKRVVPVTRQAVHERVASWQKDVSVGESPTTHSFRFDHHYMRDEEAEMDFLEGRTEHAPPPVRPVFLPPPRDGFSFQTEWEALDKNIAEGFELPSVGSLATMPPSQPRSREFTLGEAEVPREAPVPTMAQKVLRAVDVQPAPSVTAAGRTSSTIVKKRGGKRMDYLLMMGASSESEDEAAPGVGDAGESKGTTKFSLGLRPVPVLQRLGEHSTIALLPQGSGDFGAMAVGDQGTTDDVLGPDFLQSILTPQRPSKPSTTGGISSVLQRTLTSRLKSIREQHQQAPLPSDAPRDGNTQLRHDDALVVEEAHSLSLGEEGTGSTSSKSIPTARRSCVTVLMPNQGVSDRSMPTPTSPPTAVQFPQPTTSILAGSLSLGTHPLLDIGDDSARLADRPLDIGEATVESAMRRIFDSGVHSPPLDKEENSADSIPLEHQDTAVAAGHEALDWTPCDGNDLGEDPHEVPPVVLDEFVSSAPMREPSTMFECNIPIARSMPTAPELFQSNTHLMVSDVELGDVEMYSGLPKGAFDASTGPVLSQKQRSKQTFHHARAVPAVPLPKAVAQAPPSTAAFDPSRFFDGLLDFEAETDPLPPGVEASFLQLSSTAKEGPTASSLSGVAEAPKPKVPPLRTFDSRRAIAAFLDFDDSPADAPRTAPRAEEPWFARDPVSTPSTARPTFEVRDAPPPGSQTERKERRRSVVFGSSRFRRASTRPTGRTSPAEDDPFSPMVVDWEDGDA